jgi:hypothetical protein
MQGLLSFLFGLIGGAISGVLSWLAMEYLGRPLAEFRGLRREVRREMVRFQNVRARWQQRLTGELDEATPPPSAAALARLHEAQQVYRDLGSRMRSFADMEPHAVRILKRRGYDPFQTSVQLIDLSHELPMRGPGRVAAANAVMTSLRIPATRPPFDE